MKKTLIALAAVAAATGAMAQSATLYGVADLAIGKAGADSVRMYGNSALNNGSSRFGVRGSEDLGGGLKASFNVEAAINAKDGKTDAATFGRQAYAAVDGAFGQVRLGRSFTAGYLSQASYDLTGTANYALVGGHTNSLFPSYVGGTRNDSQVLYTSPSFSGLTAMVGFVAKGNSSTSKQTTDFAVIYKQGPLVASAAYSKVQDATKNTSVGASYDLGSVKVVASYQDPAGDKKGYTVGAAAPFGPVTLGLDIGRDTGSVVKSTDYAAEVKYPLSKRTFVYGALYRDGSAASDKNAYGLGLRHNF